MIDFKEFPTTRYQGSKRKILPWIYDVVSELRFESAIDIFGGSGSVSYLFKKMGKEVTYNDKLHFNFLIGKAIIENQKIRLNENDINNLLNKNEKINYRNFIQEKFSGIYYLNNENIWLDGITTNIDNMNSYSLTELKFKKAVAYYALFQSCLIKRPFNLFHRNNLEIRTRNVKRNFGNKSTWERSFEHYFRKFVDEANSLIFKSTKKCVALNKSVFDIDSYGYDLVYLDPPYLSKIGSNESSNYLNSYHFLEGISKYNEWDKLIDYDSRNRRFKNTSIDKDFRMNNIGSQFEEILFKFKNSKIVFSYKAKGVPSVQTIVKMMKKIKKRVYTVSKRYTYALNHQNGDAATNREILIIGI